jgi:ATP-dependent Clp protease protease subunit
MATKKDSTKKTKTKKKKEEEDVAPEENIEDSPDAALEDLSFLLNLGRPTQPEPPKLRVTGIYGDINEERCSETLYSMLLLQNSAFTLHPSDPDDPNSELIEVAEPFDFFVSSYGGSAVEMFGVYDVMRQIRDVVPIRTIGIGKVMSAGTLLLAAGTKGERRIGKYCRVMIHGVISGQQGHLADIENEFDEAKMTQKMYIEALAEETNMTERYIRNLIKKKSNVYLSAQEAVDLGLADIII